jgi:catechol 2,3-dioxygenase-like lactoylglutathione lyase family enzyme
MTTWLLRLKMALSHVRANGLNGHHPTPMFQQINELVSRFERGHIDRRHFVGALAALTGISASLSSSATLSAHNLTHVNIRVRDIKASEQFYRGLLGLPPAHTVVGAAYAFDLPGGGFISLCPLDNKDCGMNESPTPGEIDHFGVGVDNFKEGSTARLLKQQGLEIYDAGSSVFVKDPDGAWVQLSAPKESFKK